jgi:hypothetical protein
MALQDTLALALREALLKPRKGDVSIWSLISAGDPTSNSGTFEIGNLTASVAEEMADALSGKVDWHQTEGAVTTVAPIEPPDVEPLDLPPAKPARPNTRCAAKYGRGQCKQMAIPGSKHCRKHQPKG